MTSYRAISLSFYFSLRNEMEEDDSSFFRAKKRKIENENWEGPLLTPPLQEERDTVQQTGSQQIASDLVDLTLTPLEENHENQPTWKKIELQSLTTALSKLDKNLYDIPEPFFMKLDKDGNFHGDVKCSDSKCRAFISRDAQNKKNIKLKVDQSK